MATVWYVYITCIYTTTVAHSYRRSHEVNKTYSKDYKQPTKNTKAISSTMATSSDLCVYVTHYRPCIMTVRHDIDKDQYIRSQMTADSSSQQQRQFGSNPQRCYGNPGCYRQQVIWLNAHYSWMTMSHHSPAGLMTHSLHQYYPQTHSAHTNTNSL